MEQREPNSDEPIYLSLEPSAADDALTEARAFDLLRVRSRTFRKGRLTLTATLLAAAAFLPFAIAGPGGDLGYNGYRFLLLGLLLGIGRTAWLVSTSFMKDRLLAHPVSQRLLDEARLDTDFDTRFVARRLSSLSRVADVASDERPAPLPTPVTPGLHPVPNADPMGLVARLTDDDFAIRARATADLRRLSPEALQETVTSLEALTKRLKVRKRRWIAAGVLTGIGLMLADESSMIGQPMFWSAANHLQSFGFNLGLGFLISWPAMRLSRKAARAGAALARVEDVRACGALVTLLKSSEAEMRSFAEAALIRLLPRITASDAEHLRAADQEALLQTVIDRPNSSLALASLGAVAGVGDRSILWLVGHLAAGEGSGGDPAVRQAAAECIETLEHKSNLDAQSRALLRPAATGAEPVLLRPAAGIDTQTGATLLRAQDVENAASDELRLNDPT